MGQTFLNGESHHPRHVFKAIITGDANRMKRLNESKPDYEESISRLKEKCLRSKFDSKLINETIKKINKWEKVVKESKNEDQTTEERVMWAT